MSENAFTPPRYEETMHLVFDKGTGEVVATEQRWTLVQGSYQGEPAVHRELVKGLASSLDKREEDLDILVLRESTPLKGVIRRINVQLRKPIVEESIGTVQEGVSPSRIDAP